MVHEWYEDKDNLLELAEFLIESGQLETDDEILDYFEHPEKYTEVWKLYQKEIAGDKTGIEVPECKFRYVPDIVALIKPSAQCEGV
jgi:hypothetical protein